MNYLHGPNIMCCGVLNSFCSCKPEQLPDLPYKYLWMFFMPVKDSWPTSQVYKILLSHSVPGIFRTLWVVKVEFSCPATGGPVMYSDGSTLVLFFFHFTRMSSGENPDTTQASQATAWELGCISCVVDGMTKESDGALNWLESK